MMKSRSTVAGPYSRFFSSLASASFNLGGYSASPSRPLSFAAVSSRLASPRLAITGAYASAKRLPSTHAFRAFASSAIAFGQSGLAAAALAAPRAALASLISSLIWATCGCLSSGVRSFITSARSASYFCRSGDGGAGPFARRGRVRRDGRRRRRARADDGRRDGHVAVVAGSVAFGTLIDERRQGLQAEDFEQVGHGAPRGRVMECRRLAPALGRRHSPLSKGISRVYGNSSRCTSAIGLGRFDEISAAVVPRTASCMRSLAPARC